MLKYTLHHMTKSGTPTYDEMLSLLTQAADILNQRPLGVQHHQGTTPGYCPVTPNLLLMGTRSEASGLELDPEASDKYLRRYKFLSDCFDCWWKQCTVGKKWGSGLVTGLKSSERPKKVIYGYKNNNNPQKT